MASLYNIIKEIENFEFQVDEETGEILNADELDALEIDKNEKIENICLYIKNLRADAKAYKEEKDSFEDKRKDAEKRAERLTKYLANLLAGEKFKSSRVAVSYRKSEVVECPDVHLVDDDYLTFKEPQLDKNKIKAAFKAGVEVGGCFIVEKQNIQIK